ncbi:MAG TPA: dual specificity protein phosphatase family protein [Tepidisphaeraceae bacterium]|jgi:protein tyrosine/serine phosphatase|nr:dual specificity protein phosphatase family protein [Tepidisphaeraceae bacterium]
MDRMMSSEQVKGDPPAQAQHRRRLWIPAAIVGLCVLVGMVIWWYAGLRNQFFPDNFGVVEPGKIYRSAQISPRVLPRTLLDNNIKVIIDLSQEDSPDAQAEKKIAADLGVQRIVIPGLSGKGTGRADAYPEAIEAITRANRDGKAVLVHCQSGAQRTGGVIAIYRILVQGKPQADAWAEARRFHHRDSQNPYLVPFIDEHLAEWKSRLAAEHTALSQ